MASYFRHNSSHQSLGFQHDSKVMANNRLALFNRSPNPRRCNFFRRTIPFQNEQKHPFLSGYSLYYMKFTPVKCRFAASALGGYFTGFTKLFCWFCDFRAEGNAHSVAHHLESSLGSSIFGKRISDGI